MKKSAIFLFFLLFCGGMLSAQIPDGYYDAAIGKSGAALRTALHSIITNNYHPISYNGLWSAFEETDAKSSEIVWDIYSDVPGGTPSYEFTFNVDKCGNYSGEGDCYNREHSIPNSWFGGVESSPMYSDLFHLYPTDGWVNNKRGNLPYGEVGSANWISTNGSKTGSCTVSGYSSTVFEPIDAYKGDLARSYFYMTVRYSDQNLGQTSESMFQGSNLKAWAQSMFVNWHVNDPVSDKEINRNNVIYNNFQNNRNPFIDCPELVDFLFGERVGDAWYPSCLDWDSTAIEEYHLADYQQSMIYPNPASNQIEVKSNYLPIQKIEIYDVAGKRIQSIGNIEGKLFHIDVNSYKSGCYFVKIITRDTTETIKFIKKNE